MHPQVGELRSTLLSLRPPVVIAPHVNADVDAVASALGVRAFLKHRNIPSVLLFPSLSATAADFLKTLRVNYMEDAEVKGRDVVIVDTSSSSMLPLDVFSARKVVVIDHHRGGDLRGFVFDTPSLSEVMGELLLSSDAGDAKTYRALAGGIYADTAGLISAKPSTLRILSQLLERAGVDDVDTIARLVSRRMGVSERIARLKALRRTEIHRFGDFVVATSRAGAYEGSVAWELINAGADVAFVAGKGRIIGRASGDFIRRTGIDLPMILRVVARETGGSWGGHSAAAGIHVDDPGAALKLTLDVLRKLLAERGYVFIPRTY